MAPTLYIYSAMERNAVTERSTYQVAQMIKLAGGRYDGRMTPLTGPDLILFTDMVTKSTLALREPDVTVGNVWRKLMAKRAEFVAAMNNGGTTHA
jgi:hypothetical protein